MSHRIQVYNADVNIRKALLQQDNYTPKDNQLVSWHVSRFNIPENGIISDDEDYVEKPKYTPLNLDEVYFIACCNEIRKNNALLRLQYKTKFGYFIRTTMRNIMRDLLSNGYIRIHDSYIINELYIQWVEYPHKLWLGKYELPIGYNYLKEFKQRFSTVDNFRGGKPHRKAA